MQAQLAIVARCRWQPLAQPQRKLTLSRILLFSRRPMSVRFGDLP